VGMEPALDAPSGTGQMDQTRCERLFSGLSDCQYACMYQYRSMAWCKGAAQSPKSDCDYIPSCRDRVSCDGHPMFVVQVSV